MLVQGIISLIISEIICLVTCSVSNKTSQNVPNVDIPGFTYLVPYGRSVMLECHVVSNKPVKIKWWRSDEQIVDTDLFHTSLRTESDERDTLLLWIRSLSEQLTGTYVCSASNEFGEGTDKIYVYGYEDVDSAEKQDYIEVGYFKSKNSSPLNYSGLTIYITTITSAMLCWCNVFSSVVC